jgi:hypothetical protein
MFSLSVEKVRRAERAMHVTKVGQLDENGFGLVEFLARRHTG